MEAFAFRPALAALALALALELPYFFYRRSFVRLIERLRFQSWIVAMAAALFAVGDAGQHLAPLVAHWIFFVATVVSVDLGYRLLDHFYLARLRDGHGRLAMPKLVRDLVSWVLLFGTVALAGQAFLGVPLERLLLPSAVVSAVLGFALQDVLKNVFAGLALQLESPFDTGDWLVIDGEPRQVLEMTWRSTLMRNNLSVLFSEPNAKLSSERIENLGTGKPPMGFEVEVTVPFGVPPRVVKEALEAAAQNSSAVVRSPAAIGLLTAYGESGAVYRLRFWSHQVFAVARLLDEVRSRIWYELRRRAIPVTLPVRQVEHVAARHRAATDAEARVDRAATLFARIDLLAALPPESQRELAAAARQLFFDAGESLVAEGAPGESLFVVARGLVSVHKAGENAAEPEIELAELAPGDYFGEMSLLTGAPRSATVTARGAVEVFSLDRAALAPLLERDPALAATLSRVLAERSAATAARIEGHRDELRRQPAHEAHSLLAKIRDFFGLG